MTTIAIVTGGTRGIGRAVSLRLQEAGYRVYAIYRSRAPKPVDLHSDIKTVCLDVRDYEACKAFAELVESQVTDIGKIVLINNAGITQDAMFHKMKPEDWHNVIAVNLTGTFNMSHVFWPLMRSAGSGRLINISSINAQSGCAGQANYCASKAGLLGLTKSLALEGARKNISVNTIAPGYIDTEMLSDVPENVLNKIKTSIPMGRLGQDVDVASAVAYLCHNEAGFITGTTISVNGGQHIS